MLLGGQPIRLCVLAGRICLEIDVHGVVGIGDQVVALAERVAVERIGNEEAVSVIHGQRPETVDRRHLTFRETNDVSAVPIIVFAVGASLGSRIDRIGREVPARLDSLTA